MRWWVLLVASLSLSSSLVLVNFNPVLAQDKSVATTEVQVVVNSPILISEIKLGGPLEGQPTQFVGLYNLTNDRLNVSSLVLEYAKAGADIKDGCHSPTWIDEQTNSNIKRYQLAGDGQDLFIEPRGSLVVEVSLNDEQAGSLRLIKPAVADKPVLIYDLVGWGAAVCFQGESIAEIPEDSFSLKRKFNNDAKPLNTDLNLEEFELSNNPTPATTPHGCQRLVVLDCEDDDMQDNDGGSSSDEQNNDPPAGEDEEQPADPVNYLPIKITEILANPASPKSDADYEYVELYNPNKATVLLKDYILNSGGGTYSFTLPQFKLKPGQYLTLYASETSLTLANSGSQVVLKNPVGDIVSQIKTYTDAPAGQAWALFDGGWKYTLQSTPGKANLLKSPVEPKAKASIDKLDYVPCESDEYRNPQTHRCNQYDSTETTNYKPCDTGEYRNPATNRCKQYDSSQTTNYKPCAANEFRNPATNRCKDKNSVSETNYVPCGPGEARNPETNRCRQVADNPAQILGAINPSQKVKTSPQANYGNLILASTGMMVAGYGLYEWRREILGFGRKLGSIFSR